MKSYSITALAVLALAAPASATVFSFGGTGAGAIPDSTVAGTFGTPLLVTFPVAGLDGPITSVTLSISMTHSFIGDVEVDLSSASTSNFLIFGRVGSSAAALQNAPATGTFGEGANLGGDYLFTDTAIQDLWSVSAPLATTDTIPSGDFRTHGLPSASVSDSPETSLSAAFASSGDGTWTLQFRDRAGTDVGSVTAATLTITTVPEPSATLTALLAAGLLVNRRRR